jgi:hypothetical protein
MGLLAMALAGAAAIGARTPDPLHITAREADSNAPTSASQMSARALPVPIVSSFAGWSGGAGNPAQTHSALSGKYIQLL